MVGYLNRKNYSSSKTSILLTSFA